jgi:hypothetical protein
MEFTTLEDLFSHPVFICLLLSILLTIANIMVGVSILPADKRKKGYQLHRVVFIAMLGAYGLFLWFNQALHNNGFLTYLALVYFLFAVPLSRRANVTAHAIIASVGLVLLIGVAAFNIL